MRTNFTRLERRGTLFFCLVLTSLFLFNCSTQDLEYISPYEFVNDDFDQIGDMDEVDDPEPEFTEPETGSVEGSEATNSIITDILSASEPGEIDAETAAQLDAVGDFTNQLSPAITEQAQALDETTIANILDPDQELSADLEELRAALDDMPAEIAALLPSINFTSDFDGLEDSQEAATKQFDPEKLNVVSQTANTSCEAAAQEAYDETIASLSEQRDANMFIIESNYSRRVQEAEDRYAARLETHAEDLAANTAETSATANELLDAAEQAEAIGDTETAVELQQLALLYTVEARDALIEWDAAVLDLLNVTMEEEKATVLEIRETLTAEVNAEFDTLQAQADAVLETSINNCHDQGAGN